MFMLRMYTMKRITTLYRAVGVRRDLRDDGRSSQSDGSAQGHDLPEHPEVSHERHERVLRISQISAWSEKNRTDYRLTLKVAGLFFSTKK